MLRFNKEIEKKFINVFSGLFVQNCVTRLKYVSVPYVDPRPKFYLSEEHCRFTVPTPKLLYFGNNKIRNRERCGNIEDEEDGLNVLRAEAFCVMLLLLPELIVGKCNKYKIFRF